MLRWSFGCIWYAYRTAVLFFLLHTISYQLIYDLLTHARWGWCLVTPLPVNWSSRIKVNWTLTKQHNTQRRARFYGNVTNHVRIIIPIWYNIIARFFSIKTNFTFYIGRMNLAHSETMYLSTWGHKYCVGVLQMLAKMTQTHSSAR